jgi:hypothetical protein
MKGLMVTVQYLQGLNIFVITEQLQSYLPGCYYEKSNVMMPVTLFFQQAHEWPLEKP